MNRKPFRAALASLLLCAVLIVVACGRNDPQCQEDATDRPVPKELCINEVEGYEWDADHDSPKKRTTTRTPPPRTSTPAPTTKPSSPATKSPAARPAAPKPTTARR